MGIKHDFNKVKSYKIRWVILLAVGLLAFMLTFNHMGFGLINNISVSYYNVSYMETDWIVLNYSVGSLLVAPVLAYLVFNNVVALRKLMITASGLLLVNYVLILLSFFKPEAFYLVLLGQGIGGISKAIVSNFPPAVAVTWFPETQVGLAIGLANLGTSSGSLLAYLLLPNILVGPKFIDSPVNISNNNSMNSLIGSNLTQVHKSWFTHDSNVFAAVFFCFGCLTLVVLMFSYFSVTDLPPHAPSTSQHVERNEKVNEKRSCKEFGSATRSIFSDTVFIFYGIAFGIIYYSILLEDTMILEIIRSFLPSQLKHKAGVISSRVMAFYSLGSSIGNVVSGKLLDRFKFYKLQASAGAGFSFIFCLLVLLGCYLRHVVIVCVGMTLLGFSSRISLIPLIDSILQHHHPTNPLFLTNWLSLLRNVQGVIIVQVGRLLFNHFGPAAVLILQAGVIFLSFISSVLVKPDLNRQSTKENKGKNLNLYQ